MLGNVRVVGEGLDAEVDEHGIGFPAAEQFDGVLVDVGAEQRGGAARAEAAGAEQGGINAGEMAKSGGTGAKGGGHEGVADVVPGRCCCSRSGTESRVGRHGAVDGK